VTNRECRRYQNASAWGATGRFFDFDISSKVVSACGDDGAALWVDLDLPNTIPVTIRMIAAARTMIALRMEVSLLLGVWVALSA
jgi:hypothetical protein